MNREIFLLRHWSSVLRYRSFEKETQKLQLCRLLIEHTLVFCLTFNFCRCQGCSPKTFISKKQCLPQSKLTACGVGIDNCFYIVPIYSISKFFLGKIFSILTINSITARVLNDILRQEFQTSKCLLGSHIFTQSTA